jgi:integrase
MRLGRWKTPRYQKTRETNSEENIIEVTLSAHKAKDDLEKLNTLRRLRGVGIAVASTMLYYLQPDSFAIYDYHVRNSLKKAGRLSRTAKNNSSEVWLLYTQIIRRLSGFHSKTLREVEKALYAYDKWGCGGSDPDGKKKGEQMKTKERRKIRLLEPAEVRKRINAIKDESERTRCYECLTLLNQNGCLFAHCRKDNISVYDKRKFILRICPSTRYFSARPKDRNNKLGRRIRISSMNDFKRILRHLRSCGIITW